jgi:hypothetical protein
LHWGTPKHGGVADFVAGSCPRKRGNMQKAGKTFVIAATAYRRL